MLGDTANIVESTTSWFDNSTNDTSLTSFTKDETFFGLDVEPEKCHANLTKLDNGNIIDSDGQVIGKYIKFDIDEKMIRAIFGPIELYQMKFFLAIYVVDNQMRYIFNQLV